MIRYLLIWLALAAAITVGIGSLNLPTYHLMTVRGVKGQATVIELLPDVHGTVLYAYQVGRRTFQGQMQPWKPNPELQQLHIGQPLVIYYDPEHPEDSVLGDPRPMLENEIGSVVSAAIIIPTFIVSIWILRTLRKHAKQKISTQAN